MFFLFSLTDSLIAPLAGNFQCGARKKKERKNLQKVPATTVDYPPNLHIKHYARLLQITLKWVPWIIQSLGLLISQRLFNLHGNKVVER